MLGWNLQTICLPCTDATATAQRCQASSRTEGALCVPSLEYVRAWNPAALDTDEWVKVAVSFGAKYVVAVADHMTGFTYWDTQYHNYSMAHTAYKGGGVDLMKELLASCDKYGVRLGFFYSVHFNWFLGVDNFKVGHPPLGPKQYTQEAYLEVVKGQLEEVIGLFGTGGPLEVTGHPCHSQTYVLEKPSSGTLPVSCAGINRVGLHLHSIVTPALLISRP